MANSVSKSVQKKKEKEPKARTSQFFPFSKLAPERSANKEMIRLFTGLCKALFKELPDEEIFLEGTDKYGHYDKQSPCCGASGKLAPHGSCSRGLVYCKDGKVVATRVEPRRFKCAPCEKTHALLPDIIVPYSPYSLRFMLLVLIAYFEREETVVAVFERFGIAVSTLYEWKKRLALHKELMLGLLISQKTPALAFLEGLLGSARLSHALRDFFSRHAFSFLQRKPAAATRSRPP